MKHECYIKNDEIGSSMCSQDNLYINFIDSHGNFLTDFSSNFCPNCGVNLRPERSKREDSCKHEWHEEEMRGLNDSKFFCLKCEFEMRCSEHCSNTVMEVQ